MGPAVMSCGNNKRSAAAITTAAELLRYVPPSQVQPDQLLGGHSRSRQMHMASQKPSPLAHMHFLHATLIEAVCYDIKIQGDMRAEMGT